MPAKKATKKTTKTTKTTKKCDCAAGDCKCCCRTQSQLSFYLMVILLVVALTALVIWVVYSGALRERNKDKYAAYRGMFASEVEKADKDDNGLTLISAGATLDMLTSGKSGFLVVGSENCLVCGVYSEWVSNSLSDTSGVYYYRASEKTADDDAKVRALLSEDDDTLVDFVYIKNGVVFDRVDDTHDSNNVVTFLKKYAVSE